MLKSLQICRGFAALLVVFYHTSNSFFRLPKYFNSRPLGHLPDFGYAGVDLFFVLSGFIILYVHRQDIGRPQRLLHYLGRRTWRIYPTYWAVLLLIVPLYFVAPSLGNGSQRDGNVILRSVLLLPQQRQAIEPVLGVVWTLVFEMFFYLVFAALLIHRHWGWVVFAAWLTVLCVRPWPDRYPFEFLGHEYHFRFLAGMLAAEAVHRWRIPLPRLIALGGLTLFLGTGLLAVYADLDSPFASAGFTVGSALLLVGLVSWEKTTTIAAPRLLLLLGDASYSIYLVHQAAMSVLAKLTKTLHLDTRMPHLLLFGGFVVAATAVGVAFHILVERRLMGLGKKRAAAPTLAAMPLRQAA